MKKTLCNPKVTVHDHRTLHAFAKWVGRPMSALLVTHSITELLVLAKLPRKGKATIQSAAELLGRKFV